MIFQRAIAQIVVYHKEEGFLLALDADGDHQNTALGGLAQAENRQISAGLLLLAGGAIPVDAAVLVEDPLGEGMACGGNNISCLFSIAAGAGVEIAAVIFTIGNDGFCKGVIMSQGVFDAPVVGVVADRASVAGITLLGAGGGKGLADAVLMAPGCHLLIKGNILLAAAFTGVDVVAIGFTGNRYRAGQHPFVLMGRIRRLGRRIRGFRGRIRRFCGRI